MTLDELKGLYDKATPGPWRFEPKRLYIGGQAGPLMSYLAGNAAQPEGLKVSLGSERIADHELIAALHNSFPALVAELEALRKLEGAARYADLCYFDLFDDNYGEGKAGGMKRHELDAMNALNDALLSVERAKEGA